MMSNRKMWIRFSEEEDQKLIDLVRQNPPLYQMKGRSYKDSVVKYGIWKLIAEQLGKSVEECKMRWKGIRDYYRRRKKEPSKPKTSITGNDEKIRNKLLSFLDQVSIVETSSSNEDPFYDLETRQEQEIVWDVITDSNNDEEIEEVKNSVSSETEQEEEIEPKAKRICSLPVRDNSMDVINEIKKEHTEQTALLRELTKQLQEQPSEHEWCDPALTLFFKSIAATVSTFSPLLKAKLKVEMMNLVSRYEIEHVTQSTTTNTHEHD